MQRIKAVATNSPVIDPQDILTMREVAKRLKVSDRWVYEKTRARCPQPLPVMRIGRYIRFHWPSVSAWMLAHSNVGA